MFNTLLSLFPTFAGRKKDKLIPWFVFHDLRVSERAVSDGAVPERVYILSIKNEGGFCPLLKVYPASKRSDGHILLDVFTGIGAGEIVDLLISAEGKNRQGLGRLNLCLRFQGSRSRKYVSWFTLKNAEFRISPPRVY